MGTDNLHHKRKTRRESELSRKAGKRAPYSKVLIVTEGSKTEPLYFTKLRQHYRINKANMTIDGHGGSDPLSVVRHGRELYEQEKTEILLIMSIAYLIKTNTTITDRLWRKLKMPNRKGFLLLLLRYPVLNIGYCYTMFTQRRHINRPIIPARLNK